METIRTFIASPVDTPSVMKVRILSIIQELNRAGWKIKWVDPELLHLTYRFLGETDIAQVPEISSSLLRSFRGIKKVSAEIIRFGFFGSVRSPRVIWIGLDNAEAFSRIKDCVDMALADLIPLNDERTFRPHLTIGRVKQPGDPDVLRGIMEEERSQPRVSLEVERIIFYRSVLQKRGPVYSPLETIILK